jgi:hypothetical protein
MIALLFSVGLRSGKGIGSGAQTERQGDTGAMRIRLVADTHEPLFFTDCDRD